MTVVLSKECGKHIGALPMLVLVSHSLKTCRSSYLVALTCCRCKCVSVTVNSLSINQTCDRPLICKGCSIPLSSSTPSAHNAIFFKLHSTPDIVLVQYRPIYFMLILCVICYYILINQFHLNV